MSWLRSVWVWFVLAIVLLWAGWKLAKIFVIVTGALVLLVLLVPDVHERYSRWQLGQAGLFDALPIRLPAGVSVSLGGRT